jgi:hypothetical protein
MIFSASLISFQMINKNLVFIPFLTYLFIILVHYYSQNENKNIKKFEKLSDFIVDTQKIKLNIIENQKNKKRILLNVLIYMVMPYFPIIYALGTCKYIGSDSLLIAYCIGNLFCSI